MAVTRDHILRLVRNLLGCGCPDDVFDHIEHGPAQVESIPLYRIQLSDRLLIYLARSDTADDLLRHLPVLLAAGRKERDQLGLRRFRAVLITDNVNGLHGRAQALFDRWPNRDDNCFLHVIDRHHVLAFA